MANKQLFQSLPGPRLAPADVLNHAGGLAYRRTARQALAQYAATGCLSSTYYVSAVEQLDAVLRLCRQVDAEFVAKAAVYAREHRQMKDLPALLTCVLAVEDPDLLVPTFGRVIDTPRMLRSFVQILRSGVVGRKSLGTRPRRLVRQWLDARSDEQIFRGSVGNDPSLADIVKMVHPHPRTASRRALYAYLIGREHERDDLPELVRAYQRFQADPNGHPVPDVPFLLLTSLKLKTKHWRQIAYAARWQTLRMNLNTFLRHGVFEDTHAVSRVAGRLRNAEEIRRARVLPYQLFAAWRHASDSMPRAIVDALHDAMEHSIANVPAVPGKVFVLVDVSGSMHWAATGHRPGATSKVRCIDVAALFSAAILRRNPRAQLIPFHDDVVKARIDPRDSVMTNAEKLASLPSGGTNCSAPLAWLNRRKARGDLVVYVSDNESWVDSQHHRWNPGTATLQQWQAFKHRNPQARMVLIDIAPHEHTQAKERLDIVNVGGFSDQVFEVVAQVAREGVRPDVWVRKIESVELTAT